MLPSLLFAATISAAASSPHLDVAHVQRIEIRSTQGAGIGTNRVYDEVIERKDGELSFAGEVPSSRIVMALLKALQGSAVSTPDIRQFGFSDIGDNFVDGAAHACSGDAADLAAVYATFKSLFDQPSNQSTWLADYYGGKIFHTDDYPHESVEVTFTDGTNISAASDSQTQFMLPFTITQGGMSHKTFDTGVPKAIADLSADLNNRRLMGMKVFNEYGKWLCQRFERRLKAAAIADSTPQLDRYLREQHVQYGRDGGIGLSNDLGTVSGEIRFPEWPKGMTFAISAHGAPLNGTATQKAGISALDYARVRTREVLKLPWLANWMHRTNGAELMLSRFTASPYAMDDAEAMDELRRHAPRVYSNVVAEKAQVLYGVLWDKHWKSASTWLFLPDGRTVLVFFNATESTLGPLSKSQVVHWSSFARDEQDKTYPWRATVTVIDANGDIIKR